MALGYPPLIKESFDKSNLIGETPILIKRMNEMLQKDDYTSTLKQIGYSTINIAPRHVDSALITRNGRRNLEYFSRQLAKAEDDPAYFKETIRLLQKVMKAGPTLDRHVSTGGAYNDGFDSHEAMRETNGIPASQRALSQHALDLVIADYFGPERSAPIDPHSTGNPHLHTQQRVLHRYFDLDK